MNNSHYIKSLLLASALALGLGAPARADDGLRGEQAASVIGNQGLLGQAYGTLTYTYINLEDSSTHADKYSFSSNLPLAFGLDGILSYDYSRSGEIAGSRMKTHLFGAGLRAFSTAFNWGKPYVEAGAGFAKTSHAGIDDNSFAWKVGVGAEFQLRPATTVTPYILYMDMPDLAGDHTVNYGAKISHWIDSQWTVTAGLEFDDDQNMAFTLGTNFRF
jgi:opacity protein-like surface antigen